MKIYTSFNPRKYNNLNTLETKLKEFLEANLIEGKEKYPDMVISQTLENAIEQKEMNDKVFASPFVEIGRLGVAKSGKGFSGHIKLTKIHKLDETLKEEQEYLKAKEQQKEIKF